MTRLRIAFAVIVIALVTLILAPIQIAALFFDWKIRRRLPRYWHRIACKCLGVKIRIKGKLEDRRPLLLAVNHTSWLDIVVLGAAADIAFIAKSEVSTWPVFSVLAKLQATIFIAREDRRQTGNQVNEIADRLRGGEIIVLFPEGTTSDGNRLLPLKSSLFGAAASTLPHTSDGVVYVQPVALAYTRVHGMAMGRFHRPLAAWPGDVELLPHLSDVLKTGALDAEITFCDAIPYTENSNRKFVSRQVESDIRVALMKSLWDPD